ncbi:solute carrier family 35 member D3-like [Petromyzon marinus]|uniref:solute carrier family 35 member D3-like n=1 Tax=Petromyzon marinus TaxID=7757 RepID=UPI003F6E7F48
MRWWLRLSAHGPGPAVVRVLAAALHAACGTASAFFSRVLITQYRFVFPTFIAILETLLLHGVLATLGRARLVRLEPPSWGAADAVALPAVCRGFHHVTCLWTLSALGPPASVLLPRLAPLVCLLLLLLLPLLGGCDGGGATRGRSGPAPHELLSALLATAGALLCGHERLALESWEAWLRALPALLSRGLFLWHVERLFAEAPRPAVQTLYLLNLGSMPFLLGLLLLHPQEALGAAHGGSWDSLIFLGFLALTLTLGCLSQFLTLLCVRLNSGLGTALLDSTTAGDWAALLALPGAGVGAVAGRTAQGPAWRGRAQLVLGLCLDVAGLAVFAHRLLRDCTARAGAYFGQKCVGSADGDGGDGGGGVRAVTPGNAVQDPLCLTPGNGQAVARAPLQWLRGLRGWRGRTGAGAVPVDERAVCAVHVE